MINTRLSIFKALKRMVTEIRKHGDMNPTGFKIVLYAMILNDMIEWSQYFPNYKNLKKFREILDSYILSHSEFPLERFVNNNDIYRNVNTPQDNTTWRQINNDKKINVIKIKKNG